MKKSGKRFIFWGILWLFTLIFGVTGFILSGDYKNIKLFENWFNTEKEEEEEKAIVSLNDLSDELNNYFDGMYTNSDYIAISNVLDNKILVTINDNSENLNFEYELNGTVLSCNFATDPTENGEIIFKKLVAIVQTRYYGVSETVVMNTLNSEEISSYTLNKNYVEINTSAGFIGKLYVNKPITLINIPNYIEESDLTDDDTFKDENAISQVTAGNIILYKSKVDGYINLSIFEKDALTENSYKSLISAISVLYGSEEASLFKINYPNLSTEDFSFDNYDIIIKPTFTEKETNVVGNNTPYELIRVIIK